ncbi:MAG: dTMP kinase [Lysobacterales bacterium]|nr:MAG: dTMP kinase [Xanthomonadales bacterium]
MSAFISFEGPDGGGKSLQAGYLEEDLASAGLAVLLTREPGGTRISDQIRKVLTLLENTDMDPLTEFLLFSASRAQHVSELIRPELVAGRIVLCDRFFDSSLAYQGYGQGLDLEMLRAVTRFATGGLVPDLTLLFDIDVEQGLRRRESAGNWNRLDAYDVEFHARVRRGYHALVTEEPQRWIVLDASQDPETVRGKVRDSVLKFLAERD